MDLFPRSVNSEITTYTLKSAIQGIKSDLIEIQKQFDTKVLYQDRKYWRDQILQKVARYFVSDEEASGAEEIFHPKCSKVLWSDTHIGSALCLLKWRALLHINSATHGAEVRFLIKKAWSMWSASDWLDQEMYFYTFYTSDLETYYTENTSALPEPTALQTS